MVEGLRILSKYEDESEDMLYRCNWDGIIVDVTDQFLEMHRAKMKRQGKMAVRVEVEPEPVWRGCGPSYPQSFSPELRKRVRERDLFHCQLCGVTEEEYGKTLSVHHIDYDKQNSAWDNLTTLCNRCHVRTNADREMWTLVFTRWRRQADSLLALPGAIINRLG